MKNLPTAADLHATATPPTALQASAAQAEWRAVRIARFGAYLAAPTPAALKSLLEARGHEGELLGMTLGLQRAATDGRTAQKAVNAENLRVATERKAANSQHAQLLQQAAEENRDLRIRANAAEAELYALRASLAGLERVIRFRIIAAAPRDYRPLPRLAPRSGVFHRHLSHAPQIRRVARRIEELMATAPYYGSANRSQLADQLLPEAPAPVFDHAITHLLLSRRLVQSRSGVYRLRRAAP